MLLHDLSEKSLPNQVFITNQKSHDGLSLDARTCLLRMRSLHVGMVEKLYFLKDGA